MATGIREEWIPHLLDLRKIAHLSKPKPSEIKSLFSTGSVFVDTQTGEKEILATWVVWEVW